MKINFYKYEGSGNDFILINNLDGLYNNISPIFISSVCDRKFGIGSDGLILIDSNKDYDFTMRYFNSDGSELGFCGNGSRCIVKFAHKLGIIKKSAIFKAIDGGHYAEILNNNLIKIKMNDINMSKSNKITLDNNKLYLNNGSPHLVIRSKDLDKIDVFSEGRKIRYSNKYNDEGVNINFFEYKSKICKLRTYERGVENETLSCGTGAIATAIALNYSDIDDSNEIKISMKGGDLSISFDRIGEDFSNIWLSGEANEVYKGEINGNIKK